MATGKPIISTPVKDVVRQWSDIIHIVKNTQEFLNAVDQVIQRPDKARLEKGLALARASSWENTVKDMQTLIKEAIGQDDRRSKQKIEPLSEAELSYQYQHTQGS
jgi:hypothetical protein